MKARIVKDKSRRLRGGFEALLPGGPNDNIRVAGFASLKKTGFQRWLLPMRGGGE